MSSRVFARRNGKVNSDIYPASVTPDRKPDSPPTSVKMCHKHYLRDSEQPHVIETHKHSNCPGDGRFNLLCPTINFERRRQCHRRPSSPSPVWLHSTTVSGSGSSTTILYYRWAVSDDRVIDCVRSADAFKDVNRFVPGFCSDRRESTSYYYSCLRSIART